MTPVPKEDDRPRSRPVDVALCVDEDSINRFSGVLRHLAVGLVDQAVPLRLISPDDRIERFTLGPVQAIRHPPIRWPYRVRHLTTIKETLSPRTPSVFHATAGGAYAVAFDLAQVMDADLVVQVTSLADCDALAEMDSDRVARFIVFSQPLAAVLTEQLAIAGERIRLVRPGMRALGQIACFSVPERTVTLLCMSRFEADRGVDRLIESVELLDRRGHHVLLFLLGRGRQESMLRRLVRDRRLSSRVAFADPSGEAAPAMQSADLFVRPSGDTAFLEDTLQAMGAGAAVVACASPVCDHLRDNETALLCPAASAEGIADTVERLIKDRNFARSIAAAGMAYVKEHHAMSKMAEAVAAVYRELALARTTFPIQR